MSLLWHRAGAESRKGLRRVGNGPRTNDHNRVVMQDRLITCPLLGVDQRGLDVLEGFVLESFTSRQFHAKGMGREGARHENRTAKLGKAFHV